MCHKSEVYLFLQSVMFVQRLVTLFVFKNNELSYVNCCF